jgi:hypothetical protein
MTSTLQDRKSLTRASVLLALILALWAASVSQGYSKASRLHRADTIPVLAGDQACVTLMDRANAQGTTTDSINARRCVDSTDNARRSIPLQHMAREFARLATLHFSIPEYHDEQRLNDGAGGLGPQAFVYASPFAAGFTQHVDWMEHGTQGLLVGYVFVFPQPGESIPATYQDLYLKEGTNCVWLALLPGSVWSAGISQPSASGECLRTIAWTGTLEAKATSDRFTNLSDFPPVARFDESLEGWPLLSFECLSAYCAIGKPGFTPRPPLSVSKARENVIKGWSDEQRLVVRGAAGLVPDVRALILPVQNIADVQLGTYRNSWKPVARIELETAPAPGSKYAKWGLQQGSNYLDMRTDDAGKWSVRLRRPGAEPIAWKFLKRMPHYDVAMPSTARFRWTIGDDGMWVPCGQACCQVEGLGW